LLHLSAEAPMLVNDGWIYVAIGLAIAIVVSIAIPYAARPR
jgi:hypothetical protein